MKNKVEDMFLVGATIHYVINASTEEIAKQKVEQSIKSCFPIGVLRPFAEALLSRVPNNFLDETDKYIKKMHRR